MYVTLIVVIHVTGVSICLTHKNVYSFLFYYTSRKLLKKKKKKQNKTKQKNRPVNQGCRPIRIYMLEQGPNQNGSLLGLLIPLDMSGFNSLVKAILKSQGRG